MQIGIQRREFITLLGAAVACPFVVRAQQQSMPVVGFLHAQSPDGYNRMLAAFRRGLQELGYVEGRNVAIEYRWAQGRTDRLPAMAADLVQRQVAVIAAPTTPAAVAAKTATMNIPIVFEGGMDAVALGLVESVRRPGGNVTGVTQFSTEVAPKMLEFLHEVLPAARAIALLVDPSDPPYRGKQKSLRVAAGALGLELPVLNASTGKKQSRWCRKPSALSMSRARTRPTQKSPIKVVASATETFTSPSSISIAKFLPMGKGRTSSARS